MGLAGIGDRVEGLHAVEAAIRAGRVTKLTVDRTDERVLALVAAARSSGAEVAQVEDVGDISLTDSPQGVVADAQPITPVSLDQAVAASDPPALVVLDHLEDPRNVGAIARTAVAAGLAAIVVPTRRAAPLGATAFKAAAGALEELAIVTVSSVADAILHLKERQVWVVGLAADGERSIIGLDLLAEPVALVVGAEGKGLSRLVAERADVVASIPLAGTVESLNASVAAGLAVYELARLRGWVT